MKGDATPAPTPGDKTHPAIGLRLVLVKLERLQKAANRETEQTLRKATEAVQEAWHRYASGSRDLSHLGKSADALQQAQSSLHVAASHIPTTARGDIARIQATLSSLAQRMAGDILRVAEKSGASHRLSAARSQFTLGEIAAQQGNHTVAVSHFGGAAKLAADTITFDVALFEQNITSALAGQTTGHAFSIAYGGQLYQGGESSGVARTSADPPATAQSPVKRCTLPA